MKRRRLLLASGALLVAPLAAAQQPSKVRRLGILMIERPQVAEELGRLLSGRLGELGWQEGRDLEIDLRRADGQDGLGALAASLVASKPNALMALGPYAAHRLKDATQSIPIVFFAVADPVGRGLVASLGRPGGNITGVSHFVGTGAAGKNAEILKELVPGATRIAYLINPDNPAYRATDSFQRGLAFVERHLKISAFAVEARNAEEIPAAIEAAVRARADGLIVNPDTVLSHSREVIVQQAMKHKLPANYPDRYYVEIGGLVSYATDFRALFVRSAELADKVLRGAKPADLPVEQPTKFELVINARTAKVLGLTIPQSMLLRADRVIE